jgi:hypothetical protein
VNNAGVPAAFTDAPDDDLEAPRRLTEAMLSGLSPRAE